MFYTSEHMYAMPVESSDGNLPLMTIELKERRRRGDTTGDNDMYIHPIYSDTNTSHEYETVL